jgi:hypothetical protein
MQPKLARRRATGGWRRSPGKQQDRDDGFRRPGRFGGRQQQDWPLQQDDDEQREVRERRRRDG